MIGIGKVWKVDNVLLDLFFFFNVVEYNFFEVMKNLDYDILL